MSLFAQHRETADCGGQLLLHVEENNITRRRPNRGYGERSVWRVEAHARRTFTTPRAASTLVCRRGRTIETLPARTVRPSDGPLSSGAVAVAAVTLKRGRTGASVFTRFLTVFFSVSNAANDLNKRAR